MPWLYLNIPADPELYARVKAAAKRKFDVYPSAYANGWLVQEYKRRGGKYKKVKKQISKHATHNQKSHAGKQNAQAIKHAKKIDKQLRDQHGEDIANTWKPLVSEAMKVWYNQGDVNKPLKVKGQNVSVGGRVVSAIDVLNTMADALGVEAISMGSQFGRGSLSKELV